MKRTIENLLQLESTSIADEKLAINIVQQWHELYCPEKKRWARKKPPKGFRWENIVFSSEGEKAQEEYDSHVARKFYIMAEEFGDKNYTLYESEIKPDLNAFEVRLDFYVFPKNLAWSMAFTHESGWLGPYFSKQREYELLQKRNYESFNAKLLYK